MLGQAGDIASVLGLLVSLVGFALTLVGVVKAKNAAVLAREAATDFKTRLSRLSTVASCAEAISLMAEIRRLHRSADAMVYLPDRYAALKRLLISIRSDDSALTETQHGAVQGAIQHFSDMERQIERHLAGPPQTIKVPNGARLNEIVSLQIDKLTEILIAAQRNIDARHHV